MQFNLQRPGTDDHHRVIDTLEGLEQDVQPFVVAHHPDEQEKALAQAFPPTGHALRVGLGVGGFVKAIGNDPGLVREFFQHFTGMQVVRRGSDNPVGAGQKPRHQRLVELEQELLPDDVRVVGHHAWFVHAAEKMH